MTIRPESVGSDNECSRNFFNVITYGNNLPLSLSPSDEGRKCFTRSIPPDLLTPDTIARFWSKVEKFGHRGCWIWTSNRHPFGHGQFALGPNQNFYAHRIAWTLTHGPIPAGEQVCHHCDVPSCVNPKHLFIGTQQDNLRDASRKGRLPKARRPRKLTADDVLAIRQRSSETQSVLAAEFGVSKTCISLIRSGHRRQHLYHNPNVGVGGGSV